MSQNLNTDPRSIRSREWMTSALLDLLDEKEYEKISITEITDRAGLSRPTFYLHYKTKEDILIDHMEFVAKPLVEEFYRLLQNEEIDHPGSIYMIKFFKKIQEHKKSFKAIFSINAEKRLMPHIYERTLEYLKDLALRKGDKDIPEENLELCAQFLAGAYVGSISKWIQDDFPYDPEKIGDFVAKSARAILRLVIMNNELKYLFPPTE